MKLEDKILLATLNNDVDTYGFHILLSKDNTVIIRDYKNDKYVDLPNNVLFNLIDVLTAHLKLRV
jgi:hypothetical protein